jgi:hypothetical protein
MKSIGESIKGLKRISAVALGLTALCYLAYCKADSAYAWACAIIAVPSAAGLFAEQLSGTFSRNERDSSQKSHHFVS